MAGFARVDDIKSCTWGWLTGPPGVWPPMASRFTTGPLARPGVRRGHGHGRPPRARPVRPEAPPVAVDHFVTSSPPTASPEGVTAEAFRGRHPAAATPRLGTTTASPSKTTMFNAFTENVADRYRAMAGRSSRSTAARTSRPSSAPWRLLTPAARLHPRAPSSPTRPPTPNTAPHGAAPATRAGADQEGARFTRSRPSRSPTSHRSHPRRRRAFRRRQEGLGRGLTRGPRPTGAQGALRPLTAGTARRVSRGADVEPDAKGVATRKASEAALQALGKTPPNCGAARRPRRLQ